MKISEFMSRVDISAQKYVIDGVSKVDLLARLSSEAKLNIYLRPTVTGGVMVFFEEGMPTPRTYEEQIKVREDVIGSFQAVHAGSMRPYTPDEDLAKKAHQFLQRRLENVNPDIEIVVFDICGMGVTGSASNIYGSEVVPAATSLYMYDAANVQATRLGGGNEAIYAMRLPTKPSEEMFALTKTDFPGMLKTITHAVNDFERLEKASEKN